MWYLSIGIEVCHQLLLRLLNGDYAPWLKSRVPGSSHLAQSSWEGEAEEGVSGALDLYESLIALKVV